MGVASAKGKLNGPGIKGSFPLCKGNDKVVSGVCDGIAHYYEVDAIVVRVTCVVLLICTAGLMVIPYLALWLILPSAPDDREVLDVSPVSVVSDRYEEVIETQKATGPKAPEPYGVRADAGHVPPSPPEGKEVEQQSVYIPYRHDDRERHARRSEPNRAFIVVAVAAAVSALFIAFSNSTIARYPHLELFNFWPELITVAGITLLVCFYDSVPLLVRIVGLVFCVELTCALLPFTLGICPPYSLERLSIVPVLIVFAGAGCVAYALIGKNDIALIAAALLFGIALVWAMGEIGLFERISAAVSYSRHNISSPLFKR